MIYITKGLREMDITHDEIYEYSDLSSLVMDGKAVINSRQLTKSTLEKLVRVKDRDLYILYLEWNEICALAEKHFNAKLTSIEEVIIDDKWEILANIKDYSEKNKYEIALMFANNTNDYLLINDAFNKKVISPDNALRRLITNE